MRLPFADYILTFKAKRKKTNIEENLPFVLAHMATLSESGVSPFIIFKLISNFPEYGQITVEMKKIVRNIEVLHMDPVKACREVVKEIPSDQFRKILLDYVDSAKSGKKVNLFLKNTATKLSLQHQMKMEKYVQQLVGNAELFTGILIAAPLLTFALFSFMALIQPSIEGYNIVDLTRISTYFFIPLLDTFLLFHKRRGKK